jgi:hypothetical protein
MGPFPFPFPFPLAGGVVPSCLFEPKKDDNRFRFVSVDELGDPGRWFTDVTEELGWCVGAEVMTAQTRCQFV